LRENKDSAKLASSYKQWAGCPYAFILLIKLHNKQGECAMPIELLVPITIFLLGVVVSVKLSSMGIECIVEGKKK
jgi:hypothetical protein